jgi:nucleoside-diphosphate-sugar epimerase
LRVFVAGATGAIGRVLVPQLLARGHEVVGMTRSPERAEALRAAGARAEVVDAFDAAAVARAVDAAAPDVVVDEMTDLPPSFPSSRKAMAAAYAANDRVRLEASANVHAAARDRRVVGQSVAFFYAPGAEPATEDTPLALDAPDPVGDSVRAVAALEARVLGGGGTILRYGQFYGPGTWFAPDGSIAGAVRARRYPIIGGGPARGTFVHVEDAAAATVAAIETPVRGAFNVAADESPPLHDWLPRYAEALGAPPPRRVPTLAARLAAGPAAVWFMTQLRGVSSARAKAELGFAPRPLTTPAEA